MTKRLQLFLCLTALVTTTFAAPVSQQQARQKAAQFALSRQAMARGKNAATIAQQLTLALESSELYAYNVGQQGFVIISGDDRTDAVLAFSDSGTLDAQQMPPAMKAWVENLQEEIRMVGQGQATARQKRVMHQQIEPLLEREDINWGQNAPDNLQTPIIDDQHAVTGCVATAMAQVMRYYHFPDSTLTGIPAYTTRSLKIQVDSLVPTHFDWTLILDDDADERAKLLAYCGAAVHMDYTLGSSGASDSEIAPALVNIFGFDRSASRFHRSGFTIDEWEEKVYAELAAERPVIYGGQSSGGGHQFVCDGYNDENGLFHINWGWYGSFNGYYSLSVLDARGGGTGASTTADGYSMDQTIITHLMKPQDNPEASDGTPTVEELTVTSGTTYSRASSADAFSGIATSYKVWNFGAATHTYIFGLALYQGENLVQTLQEETGTHSMGVNYGSTLTRSISIPATVGNGTYRIVPVAKIDGASTWTPLLGTNLVYQEAQINGNTLTLTAYPKRQLEITSLYYPNGRIANRTNELVAIVSNKGSEYNGTLHLIYNKTIYSQSGVYIRAGEQADVRFHLLTSPNVMQITIAEDEAGTKIVYQGPDQKTAPTVEGNDVKISELNVSTTDGYAQAGSALKATLNVADAGTEKTSSYVLVYSLDGGDAVAISNVPSLASSMVACSFDVPIDKDISAGQHTLTVSVSQINGKEPETFEGHEVSTTFVAYHEALQRQKVMLNYYTWLSSGYFTTMDGVANDLVAKSQVPISRVSIHFNDELASNASRELAKLNPGGGGIPGINMSMAFNFDRYANADENQIEGTSFYTAYQPYLDIVQEKYQKLSFATVDLSAVKDTEGNIIVTASGHASEDLSAIASDAALTLMITEDNVVERAWDGQKGEWVSDYSCNGILRTILTPTWGTSVEWDEDGNFEHVETFQPNASWKEADLKVVAIIGKPYVVGETDIHDVHIQNCNDLSLANLEVVDSGIRDLTKGDKGGERRRYTLDGRQLQTPQHGLNIVRYGDGTVRKVIVK